jgi:amphi-Trp domain-containing protein
MSKDEIEQKATLSRQEVARWLADLAKAIEEGGTMQVSLAGPPVTLELPDEFRCELEIEPHGDTVELEIELTWPRTLARARDDGPVAATLARPE